MEPLTEPVSVRVSRLNSQLVSNKLPGDGAVLGREGLLDALVVLYDECNADCIKKYDRNAAAFVEKRRKALDEARRLRVNLTDFEVKDAIGRGHFADVHIVREKQTGDVYAMKMVKKSACLSQRSPSYEEERDIMAKARSPWLTALQYAFQDSNSLYYIMEYHSGGDLAGLLHRQGGTIPESAAGFYVAEVVVALNDLHKMKYVHRDVKPENILLDRCGHVKLADFGSAARLNSAGFVDEGMPVGTPDYIAPEVLESSDNKHSGTYGISCDYWSVGVLAYQLTVGRAPFTGLNTPSTYSKIMSHNTSLKFPADIVLSQAFVALVRGLLSEASSRLTYGQVVKHPLFKKVDFSGLRDQVPPYVPKVDAVDDTANFFDVSAKKSEPDIDNFKTKTQFSGKHLPFIGFTYTYDACEYRRANPHAHEVKNEQMEELKKEVRGLQKQLKQTEELVRERQLVGSKLEEKARQVENLESLRDRLERDLADAIAECATLKRTLELERKDRADLERKALELIKSAKMKWENVEKSKVSALTLELDQQREQIQRLVATNEMLNGQLQHALQLENKHKTSVESVQQLSRQSVVGLESRLEKISSDSQDKIAELQARLADESHRKTVLQNQLTTFQYSQASLKEKLKSSEENCNALLLKLEANQRLVRELENKAVLLEDSTRCIGDERKRSKLLEEELKAQSERKVHELEERLAKEKENAAALRNDVKILKEEVNSATRSQNAQLHEQSSLSKRLEEVRAELRQTLKEKGELEVQLGETKLAEQTNKVKVQSLEDLLKRLESGVSKLENDCDKDKVLKEQVERLEQQLIQVHEQAAVEKQQLSELRTKFWRAEKDLSNAEIDKRIYKRELKESAEEKAKLSAEIEALQTRLAEAGRMHEEALLELGALNENLASEVAKLRGLIQSLEGRADLAQEKCDAEKTVVDGLKGEVKSREAQVAKLASDVEALNVEKKDLVRMLEAAESKYNEVVRKLERKAEENNRSQNELDGCRRQLRNTQLNLEALREACTLLETQLEEYEKIHAAYELNQHSLKSNTERLIADLARAKREVQQTKEAVNEERSSKIATEQRCKRLEEEVESLAGECSAYKEQCTDFRQYSAGLTEELAAADEKLVDFEVAVKSHERQLSHLMMENKMLKEENSTQLTHLQDVKESNYRLEVELAEYKRSNGALAENVAELRETLEQKHAYYKEREVKANGTIQQQTKLIDFLQTKVDESNRKKKTLSDKLFRRKENQPPLPMNYKDLENMLCKERDLTRELREELSKLKQAASAKKEAKADGAAPMSPRTKVALARLAESPSVDGTQSELRRQKSLQRMHHNIPHRFETKLCTKSFKCVHCSNQIPLGRTAKYCSECQLVAHQHCAKSLPKTCGVPQALVRHYSDTLTRQKSAEDAKEAAKPEEEVDVEGWVKIPVKGNGGWERHYACLTASSLKIYAQPPHSSDVGPVEALELHPPDSHSSVILEPVSSEIGASVASSDLPFVMKVQVVPNTTCWPAKSVVLMTLSVQDKEKWYKALQGAFERYESKYQGEPVFKHTLKINQLVDLDDVKLLATDEGLYAHNKTVSHIAGPLHVHQIRLVPSLNMAAMIVDWNKFLITCDLQHLRDTSRCAPCSRPTLAFKTVNVNNLQGFHLLEVAQTRDEVVAAVATQKQLVVLSYDHKLCDFVPLRALDTAEPTSCLLFSERSLIVGANRFFEVDLKSFEADEFLDESDKRLSQAILCYNVGSLPFAIAEIKRHEEYLLCFREFGLFVDEYGRCSRSSDLKWSRLPQAIHYAKPYLYLVQFASVEVIKITADTCNPTSSSLESLPNVDSFAVDLKDAKYLGANAAGVYVDAGGEVHFVRGRALDADAESTCEDDDDEAFSFTSSMMQSLDGNLSDAEEAQKKKVTFGTQISTNL